jgi:hypothetical protein
MKKIKAFRLRNSEKTKEPQPYRDEGEGFDEQEFPETRKPTSKRRQLSELPEYYVHFSFGDFNFEVSSPSATWTKNTSEAILKRFKIWDVEPSDKLGSYR